MISRYGVLSFFALHYLALGAMGHEEVSRDKRIEAIYISGTKTVSSEEVMKVIKSRRGAEFKRAVWEEDRERLLGTGLFADIWMDQPSGKTPGGGILLLIDVTENPVIEKISIKGDLVIGIEPDLRKEINFCIGRLCTQSTLKQCQEIIKGEIEKRLGIETVVDAQVNVTKFETHEFRGTSTKVESQVEISFKVSAAGKEIRGSIPGSVMVVSRIDANKAIQTVSSTQRREKEGGNAKANLELTTKDSDPKAEENP